MRELYRIGEESARDNIERGGIGVIENGELTIYEIANDLREDEERFTRFARGEDHLYGHLASRAQMASSVQIINSPQYANAYSAMAAALIGDFSRLLALPPNLREIEAKGVYPRFDAHVRHHMYIADTQRLEELSGKTRAFCFHTHWGGSPPSPVDVQLSHSRPEVVISVGPLSRAIYYINDGQTEIVHQDTPTAMR